MGPAGPAFPAVRRDDASASFFDAAACGQLLVRRCPASGDVLAPEARTCPSCGSAGLDDVVASGRGTLVSWAVVHQAPVPSLAAAVPYVSVVVELAEGPWLLARLVESDASGLRAGTEVEVRFVRSGEPLAVPAGEVLPAFAVASRPGEPVSTRAGVASETPGAGGGETST
ncbi:MULTISPECIES: OB-fold domain-containing protein [unclassified Frankia]|uniref:Zn-ribbon domain-containing OB-fold protein n=1 Tax=unclassified Frankia TaxID=2632575 RepID=UPI0027DE7F48|nr:MULTISPECIES: OB-fold domain-containing protein [unclassified Frankia]